MEKFVHLHTHSHYSLLDGLPKIPELVDRVKELGMNTVAITDHGNLYAAVEFYKKATSSGVKPILGVEAYIAPGSRLEKNLNGGEKYYHLILLVKNETGWKNLLKLVTASYLEGFYYKPRMDKELLGKYHEGLIALSGCLAGEVSRNLMAKRPDEAEKAAREYQSIFGAENFYLEIGHHPGIKETLQVGEDLIALSHKTGIPLVATQDIHYLKKEDAYYHDILLAVQTGNKLDDPDRLTLKNDDFSMRSPEEMAELFKNTPEAITNTVKIAEACSITLELDKIRIPKFNTPEGYTATTYLRKLLEDRLKWRYPEPSTEVLARIEFEQGVIERMGFADYFLIVQDFINWAKNRGIVVGPGRGSAAGSIVSYILGITNLDPIAYDLIFERFLNPDRIQMPDIDVDIADTRRDEVMGYLKETYGEDRVANIITFGTMAARAAVRDVGRALGMSYTFCDQIAKLIPFVQSVKTGLEGAIKEVRELHELYEHNPDAKKILDAAMHLEGVARHASVHACGTVISSEPLVNFLPLQRAPQDDNVIVSQFEMHAVENLGLLKIDLLGLRNLTTIENTLRLVRRVKGEEIDINRIPLKDQPTFAMLQRGETSGVFQFESSGMTRYLKELRPTEIEDLIAMVALYRPGPMELIPEYIARKHGKKTITYLHPKLEPVLNKTYGIMIYQEQLMNGARMLASFTLSEADVLRKAVGKKIRKLLMEQKEKLINGCIKNGIPETTANEFWALVEPFDRYGFNRSHAACYAMIAYQTAYLRAHYPVEFMTSLLNAESKDIDRITYLVGEAKKQQIEILAPDINHSDADFTPEGSKIRFGLAAIKNVGQKIVEAMIDERTRGGDFVDLPSFLSRVQHKDLNKKSLESLIKCGALDSFGVERAVAIANIEEILKFATAYKRQNNQNQMGLFGVGSSSQALKLQPTEPAPSSQKLIWEKELLGLYVSDHPLNQYREKFEKIKAKPIKDALLTPNRRSVITGGIIVSVQHIITKTGKAMAFAKIQDFWNTMEVIVFPEKLDETRRVWEENKVILVAGKMSTRDGETKLICDSVREV